jgi:hypothetical protein
LPSNWQLSNTPSKLLLIWNCCKFCYKSRKSGIFYAKVTHIHVKFLALDVHLIRVLQIADASWRRVVPSSEKYCLISISRAAMLVFLLCHKKGEGIHAQPMQDYTAYPKVPSYKNVHPLATLLIGSNGSWVILSSVPYCDFRYDFGIRTMFGSSLPPVVCRRTRVLFTLFLFVCP